MTGENMTDQMLTKKDFRAAAKLISTKFTKNEFFKNNCYCAVGALGKVKLGDDEGGEQIHAGLFPASCDPDTLWGGVNNGDVIRESITSEIIHFNDKRSTTREDVQTLLLLLGEMA
jgi:hypothetical protein